jgi:hypothetical protein
MKDGEGVGGRNSLEMILFEKFVEVYELSSLREELIWRRFGSDVVWEEG